MSRMRNTFTLLLLACLVLGPVTALLFAVKTESTRSQVIQPIRVLFLGDKGHHQPAQRAKQLLPYLASSGIDATYTEDANDLNPQTLSQYDALLIYANIEQIRHEQEKALLEYVD